MENYSIQNSKLSFDNGEYYFTTTLDNETIKRKIATADDNVADSKAKTKPLEFELYQNYPNPFNHVTKFKFSIPKSGIVKLLVYNELGHDIKTLMNEFKFAGVHSSTIECSDLPGGIYFYTLVYQGAAEDFIDIKRMRVLQST